MSSLLMVLLLLTLGSLLLEGLNLQQRALLAQTASETQAIRDTAIAHSALQWGKQQVWSAQVALACRGAGAAGLARLSAYLRRRFTGAQQRQRRGAGLAVRRGARRAGAFSAHGWAILPAQGGELMSNALKRQRGLACRRPCWRSR